MDARTPCAHCCDPTPHTVCCCYFPSTLQLTAEMQIENVLARSALSLADLRELEAAGYITSTSKWAEWLAPDIHWITPTEFADAFEELMKDEHDA